MRALKTTTTFLPTLFFLLLLSAPALTSTPTICNNSPALCTRAYNNITHLGAHDSPFIRNATNDYSFSGDQFYPTTTQLDAGVRLLTAQVHAFTTDAGATEWHLCHTECALYDAGTLAAWLGEVKTWLEGNEGDVVTLVLVNSDDATAEDLDAQFAAAGIKEYAYTPTSMTQAQATWPTLEELITAGTRLVTFVASLDSATNTAAPYLLDEFTFIFETAYNIIGLSAFSCLPDRPASVTGNTALALSTHLLPFVNHFLYDYLGDGIDIPAVDNVSTTNSPSTTLVGSLGYEADACTVVYGRAPTFMLVDFFNVGAALETVDRLNGVLGDTQGREKVSTAVLGRGDATGSVSAIAAASSTTSSMISGSSTESVGTVSTTVVATTVATTATATSTSTTAATTQSSGSSGQSTTSTTTPTTSVSTTSTVPTEIEASPTAASNSNKVEPFGWRYGSKMISTLLFYSSLMAFW